MDAPAIHCHCTSMGHLDAYLLSDYDAAVRWTAKMGFDLGKRICNLRLRTPEGLVADDELE